MHTFDIPFEEGRGPHKFVPNSSRTSLFAFLKSACLHLIPDFDEEERQIIQPYTAVSNKVSFHFARLCLQKCHELHIAPGSCRSSDRPTTGNVGLPKYLIDVQECRLVRTPANPTYAALSYVWGANNIYAGSECTSANLPAMRRRAHSPSEMGYFRFESAKFPPTIMDSITFTRETGERYLWIDRYCIVQDRPEENQDQISSIGSIYRNASFTIFAAEGDAMTGLPGMP